MTDIIPIKQAMACGYTVYWRRNSAWFFFTEAGREYVNGPYKTLEDAAYAALSDYEKMLAWRRIVNEGQNQ